MDGEKRRRSMMAVAVCVLALGVGACSSDDEGGGSTATTSTGATKSTSEHSGTLKVPIGDYPATWAPGTDAGETRIPYETLVTRAPTDPADILPELATEWEQTDEALTLTLREGVKFHDGEPFNAEAVKANIEFVEKEAGPYSAAYTTVESVEAVDEHTVKLNLSKPSPALLTSLTERGGMMASPKALADGTVKEMPVGTGPWKFDEQASTPGSRAEFASFEDYWDPSAYSLQTIELISVGEDARFAALQAGEVDYIDFDDIKQAEQSGFEVSRFTAGHGVMLFLDRAPGGKVGDVEVRRAMCQAVRGEAVLAGAQSLGTALPQRFAEGTYGYSPDAKGYPYAPDEARAVLEGKDLDLSLAVYEGTRPFGEAVAGELGEAGLDLKIQQVSEAEYHGDWAAGKWPVGVGENSEQHPFTYYTTWFAADAPNNPSGWEPPELKAAADKAIAAGSSPEAKELWQEVMRIISDQALVCMHLDLESSVAWNSEAIQGLEPYDYEVGWVNFKDIKAVE